MGGRSDHTKYITELPMLAAWGEQYPLLEDSNTAKIQEYRGIAVQKYGEPQWEKNLSLSRSVRDAITGDMRRRGFAPVTGIGWQGNQNQNSNGSHADILFVGHPVGGVSVKSNGTNHLNLGLSDFRIGNPRGQDVFEFLCPQEFGSLLSSVKTQLLAVLDETPHWSNPETPHYSITRLDNGNYQIFFRNTSVIRTRDQVMAMNRPKKYLRVFGDFYQENKETLFLNERESLDRTLRPQVENIFQKFVQNSPQKIEQLAGYARQPQYIWKAESDSLYYIPEANSMSGRLRLESFEKTSDGIFGAGISLKCILSPVGGSGTASVEWHMRYNDGTFANSVVNTIQGMKDEEALWERVR